MSKTNLLILCSLLAAALIFPFLAGQWLSTGDFVFGGFLLNPVDGNSYLAKMRIGWQGDWLFTLPYTAESSGGAYIFLFYIALGHIARVTTLSIPLVFHLARLLASVFLVYALYRLLRRFVSEISPTKSRFIFALLLFGSGLGWVAALLGAFTSDFWVAEAFPFLSMYANPHFPLGLGFLILFFDYLLRGENGKNSLWLLPFGFVTAIIQPFAIVIGALVSGIYVIWDWRESNHLKVLPAIFFIGGGGVVLIYQYFAIINDPLLMIWNAQNITESPQIEDIVISFSPVLILAGMGIYYFSRKKELGKYKLLVIWLVAGIILAYLPFSLQRRFLTGFYVPCALLGGIAVSVLLQGREWVGRFIRIFVILSSILTNLFVVLGGISGILNKEPLLFISHDEKLAFNWMDSQTVEPGVILASEQTGLFIPAYTGWRVIYGHPFETVNAEQKKNEISELLSPNDIEKSIDTYISENQVKYIFWGPRENIISKDNPFSGNSIAYQNATVTIYTTTY